MQRWTMSTNWRIPDRASHHAGLGRPVRARYRPDQMGADRPRYPRDGSTGDRRRAVWGMALGSGVARWLGLGGTDDVGAPASGPRRNRPFSPPVAPAPALDGPYGDRIVVFGSTPDTIGLLHLAVCSDDVLLIAAAPDGPLPRTADRLGIARRDAFDASDLDGAATVLVVNGRSDGRAFTKCNVTDLLQNRRYRSDLVHRGPPLPGVHDPIVIERSWTKLQEAIAEVARRHRPVTPPSVPNPLKGLLFGPNGRPISQTFGYNGERLNRYYSSAGADRCGAGTSPTQRYRAPEFDAAVLAAVEETIPNGPRDRQSERGPEKPYGSLSPGSTSGQTRL